MKLNNFPVSQQREPCTPINSSAAKYEVLIVAQRQLTTRELVSPLAKLRPSKGQHSSGLVLEPERAFRQTQPPKLALGWPRALKRLSSSQLSSGLPANRSTQTGKPQPTGQWVSEKERSTPRQHVEFGLASHLSARSAPEKRSALIYLVHFMCICMSELLSKM